MNGWRIKGAQQALAILMYQEMSRISGTHKESKGLGSTLCIWGTSM